MCLLIASATHSLADDFSVKLTLGIRDNTYVAAKDRVEYPLAFRAENTGKKTIKEDQIPRLFFKGTIHVLSEDGREHQASVQGAWRTATIDLPPGQTSESPVYADLLAFFPSLKDGEYQVWWTREEAKSNVLHFAVTRGKLRSRQSKI